MSKMGQFVQELQEGEPEPMVPDPLYDEREQKDDPGYIEFLINEANNERIKKWSM